MVLSTLWLHWPHVPRLHLGCWISFSFPAFVCFPGPTGGSVHSLTPCSSSSMMKSVSWSSDAAQEVSPPLAPLLSSLVFLHSSFSNARSDPSKSHLYVPLNKALYYIHCCSFLQVGWNERPTIKNHQPSQLMSSPTLQSLHEYCLAARN